MPPRERGAAARPGSAGPAAGGSAADLAPLARSPTGLAPNRGCLAGPAPRPGDRQGERLAWPARGAWGGFAPERGARAPGLLAWAERPPGPGGSQQSTRKGAELKSGPLRASPHPGPESDSFPLCPFSHFRSVLVSAHLVAPSPVYLHTCPCPARRSHSAVEPELSADTAWSGEPGSQHRALKAPGLRGWRHRGRGKVQGGPGPSLTACTRPGGKLGRAHGKRGPASQRQQGGGAWAGCKQVGLSGCAPGLRSRQTVPGRARGGGSPGPFPS